MCFPSRRLPLSAQPLSCSPQSYVLGLHRSSLHCPALTAATSPARPGTFRAPAPPLGRASTRALTGSARTSPTRSKRADGAGRAFLAGRRPLAGEGAHAAPGRGPGAVSELQRIRWRHEGCFGDGGVRGAVLTAWLGVRQLSRQEQRLVNRSGPHRELTRAAAATNRGELGVCRRDEPAVRCIEEDMSVTKSARSTTNSVHELDNNLPPVVASDFFVATAV